MAYGIAIIDRIAPAPRRGRQAISLSMSSARPNPRPLADLKVLELGALIAGPFCTKVLAEFGAEVIKIEPPGQATRCGKWR